MQNTGTSFVSESPYTVKWKLEILKVSKFKHFVKLHYKYFDLYSVINFRKL